MRGWLELVVLGAQDGVSGDMGRIVLFTAAPQGMGGRGVEDGRSWL